MRRTKVLTWLVVALIANAALLRTVHAQSVIDLDPAAFAPGTNVSTAFTEATLSAMSLVSDGTDPTTGLPLWTPTYAPVYANGNFFTDSATPVSVTAPSESWENSGVWVANAGEPKSGDCFKVCAGGNGFGNLLLVSFASPVSFASALQTGNRANGDLIEAFNSSDQLVASCIAAGSTQPPVQPVGNYGCYSVVNNAFFDYQEETSVSAMDVSKILMGGQSNGGAVGDIFAVSTPEIDSTSASSGFAVLLGGLVVLRGRRLTPCRLSTSRMSGTHPQKASGSGQS
jgi:hypothetical protein